MNVEPSLLRRANDRCELCGSVESLGTCEVASSSPRESAIVVCGGCALQLPDASTLDASHWRCLETAIWSEVPAVQVAAYRLLARLRQEHWAAELLESAYLDDAVLAWAKEGRPVEGEQEQVVVKDSNGAPLAAGDSVTLIKDLDVKGAGFTAKRGTLVKGIRLTDDARHVEGRIQGSVIVLKVEFLKKA
jgi:protein PhnA